MNALRELFAKFEATTGSSAEMWEFYDGLSVDLKILIWEHYPQHREALRAEERRAS
jgi:hypothetical protein